MCASAARARLAETTFTYNGTGDLSNLKVERRFLNSTEMGEQPPVWGLERTNLNYTEIDPLWGVIDEKHINSPTLHTLRRDYFYLPASRSCSAVSNISDTVASATVPAAVVGSLYEGRISLGALDYTGSQNLAIFQKWADAGNTTDGVANMCNLVFVDMMTQLIVGSKSLLDANKVASTATSFASPVQIQSYQIQYQLLYAIPVNLSSTIYLMEGACHTIHLGFGYAGSCHCGDTQEGDKRLDSAAFKPKYDGV